MIKSKDISFLGGIDTPDRINHEKDRAKQRAIFIFLISAIVLFFLYKEDYPFDVRVAVPTVGFLYFVLSLIHLKTLKNNTKTSLYLQYLFFIIDLPITVLGLALAPTELAFLHPFLLFLVMGVGIRYGRKVMIFSTVISLVCFSLVTLTVDFWQKNVHMTIAIFLMLMLIPLYFGVLIKKIENISGELHKMAMFDVLTGMGNRRLLMDQLEVYLSRSNRMKKPFAVFYFDLDNFKTVNDKLGHKVGDELLSKIAQKLKSMFRSEDFMARIGGDEFVMLAELLKQPDDAVIIAEKILNAVHSARLEVCPLIEVSASIGVVMSTDFEDQKDVEKILTMADNTMYIAKKSGKSNFAFFKKENDKENV